MKNYKIFTDSTLMRMTKVDLIKKLRTCEKELQDSINNKGASVNNDIAENIKNELIKQIQTHAKNLGVEEFSNYILDKDFIEILGDIYSKLN